MPTPESPASKSAEKFVVRLPMGMRKRIAEAARCARRSMNSEIVARLEQTLESDPPKIQKPVVAPDGSVTLPSNEPRELERRLLVRFRRLSSERQRALLALLD